MTGKPAEGIAVKYIYSACIVTRTRDVSILHDPWFTDGIYDGSWYQFPKIADPMAVIGDVDAVYISHVHPDHYDPLFLRAYFDRFGEKPLYIADHRPNHLAGKMRTDGFKPEICSGPVTIGDTRVEIIAHRTGSASDIDSAILLKLRAPDRVHCVVNANDIIFDDAMRRTLKEAAGDVDILLCGFTGAGPYPQTYFELGDPQLPVEADKKKHAFFDRYRALTGVIDARINIPFAGKYLLGGHLADLNNFRGVADPVEMLARDERAVVLAEGGEIDTATFATTAARTTPYDADALAARLREIGRNEMRYEALFSLEEAIRQLPLRKILGIAARNARAKSECGEDYYYCLRLGNADTAIINANKAAEPNLRFVTGEAPLPTPRSEILIDPRYLFGLLTHIYHWNNAEVGSQFHTRRTPNIFNRQAQTFLNYLCV